MRPCLSIGCLLAALLAIPVAAQSGAGARVDSLAIRTEVAGVEALPVAGLSVDVVVTIFGFPPSSVAFFYRLSGATGPFTETLVSQSGKEYRTTLPAEDVTIRGLDVYVEYVEDGTTFSFPAQSPTEFPLRVPVVANNVTAPVALTPRQYRMISVPLDLDDPSVEAVLGDDYGPYEPARWRAARWQPDLEAYEERLPFLDDLVPGVGMWLVTASGAAFDAGPGVSVGAGESKTMLAPVSVLLQPGWNQIGTPYAFPVDWIENVNGNAFVGVPVGWTGEDYEPGVFVLEPWEGYFVFNPEPEPVRLTFFPVEAEGQAPAPVAQRVMTAASASYALQLSAAVPVEGLADDYNFVGFTDGPARVLHTPPAVGVRLELSVLEDGVRRTAEFASAGEGRAWDIEVTASGASAWQTPRAVQVRLAEHGIRPPSFERYVLDLDEGEALPAESAFTVELSATQPVRRLRVIEGTPAFAEAAGGGIPLTPSRATLEPIYPNPLSIRRGTSATLAYVLPHRGPVTLDVFDLLGRRVRTLVQGVEGEGRHERHWDGRDALGGPVASGLYLIRLEAGGQQATRTVAIVR